MTSRPLNGVRVLDFTWSVAGPTMTRYLASLGAEVIKTEWPTRADPMRSAMFRRDEEEKHLNNGPFFANLNVGKRSLTVNVRSDEGLQVIRDLVKECDVVAESFSSTVMDKWGLSYEHLRSLNPAVIYVSMSGFGHTGPHSDKSTWGPTAQAMSGITYMSGGPREEPAGWGWSYLDVASGYMGAAAVLSALVRSKRAGLGARLDMSQVEVGISLIGSALREAVVTGVPLPDRPIPVGSRSTTAEHPGAGHRGDNACPSNLYPTAGEDVDAYCAISVTSDEQWAALVDAMGSPVWAMSAALGSHAGRLANQDTIDDEISAWTRTHGKYELMDLLQRRGIPAGAMQTAEDRVEHDPQLRYRGLFERLDHPHVGQQLFEGCPFRSDQADYSLQDTWPSLGEGNEYVLRDILRYTDDQLEELDRKNTLWPDGVQANPPVLRSLW